MVLRFLHILSVFALIFMSTSAFAEELKEQSYALPGHGSLQLMVPTSWQSDTSQAPGNVAPTIKFHTSIAQSFVVLLTPTWAMTENTALPDLAEVQRTVAQTARAMQTRAMQTRTGEKQIPINKLTGSSSAGYYFSATDKAPKPGEYKYLTQGIVRLGGLEIAFTVLTNDGQENAVADALAILQSAEHTIDGKSSAKPAGTARPDAIQLTHRDNGYVLTVPLSRLVMRVPANGLSPKKDCCGGAAGHPRYFHFEDSAAHVQVSGWIEAAQGFSGIEKFWARETGAWKKNGLPKPRNALFAKIDNWDAIVFDLDIPGVTSSHIRAHWLQAGTWIDIHLSITTDKSSDDARSQLESLLKTIAVTEKNNGDAVIR